MRPSSLVYQLSLRNDEGARSILRLMLAFEGAGDAPSDEYDVLDIKPADATFLPFDGHVAPVHRPAAPV
eukprot:109420-Prymnesium_polylepis.1